MFFSNVFRRLAETSDLGSSITVDVETINFKSQSYILRPIHMVITDKDIMTLQASLNVTNGGKFEKLSSKKMTYAEGETLALDLGLQWEILKEKGYTVLDMPPEAVRVYRSGHYGLDVKTLEEEDLLVPIENGSAIIDCPLEHGDRMAPELMFVIRLPAVCNPTAALYSLKCLCVEQMGIEHNLEAIMGTKLYYLLERCSRPDAKDRCFLFI